MLVHIKTITTLQLQDYRLLLANSASMFSQDMHFHVIIAVKTVNKLHDNTNDNMPVYMKTITTLQLYQVGFPIKYSASASTQFRCCIFMYPTLPVLKQ